MRWRNNEIITFSNTYGEIGLSRHICAGLDCGECRFEHIDLCAVFNNMKVQNNKNYKQWKEQLRKN